MLFAFVGWLHLFGYMWLAGCAYMVTYGWLIVFAHKVRFFWLAARIWLHMVGWLHVFGCSLCWLVARIWLGCILCWLLYLFVFGCTCLFCDVLNYWIGLNCIILFSLLSTQFLSLISLSSRLERRQAAVSSWRSIGVGQSDVHRLHRRRTGLGQRILGLL